jgi:hypothetical protein
MTMHLNENDVHDYLKGGRNNLPENRRAHLDTCDYCQQQLKEHTEVGSILTRMRTFQAPAGIYETVIQKINRRPVHKKDWFFYITLTTLAVVALLLFFDFGSEKIQKKSVKEEQIKDFIQEKMSIDKLKIEENTVHVYQNFISVMKKFTRTTYGSTSIFVLLVILFYLFVDQQFLRKKLNQR